MKNYSCGTCLNSWWQSLCFHFPVYWQYLNLVSYFYCSDYSPIVGLSLFRTTFLECLSLSVGAWSYSFAAVECQQRSMWRNCAPQPERDRTELAFGLIDRAAKSRLLNDNSLYLVLLSREEHSYYAWEQGVTHTRMNEVCWHFHSIYYDSFHCRLFCFLCPKLSPFSLDLLSRKHWRKIL
jgi:hypothetical protein